MRKSILIDLFWVAKNRTFYISKKNLKKFQQPSEPSSAELEVHNLDYIANIHLQFIGKIIKDIKLRTNRILLGQLGREIGKELGHNVNALQKEENVHVGRLCKVKGFIFRPILTPTPS